jgi:hypothetical protein
MQIGIQGVKWFPAEVYPVLDTGPGQRLDSGFHRNDNSDALLFTCSWPASFQDQPTISQT